MSKIVQKYSLKTSQILDFGGGYGQITLFLKNSGYNSEVFEIYEFYEPFLNELGVKYKIVPSGDLPYPPKSIDVFLENCVLQFSKYDPREILLNAKKVLKDDGIYIAGMYLNNDYWLYKLKLKGKSPHFGLKRMSYNEIIQLFKSEGFILIHKEQFQFFPANQIKIDFGYRLIWLLDRMLCKIPFINNYTNSYNMIFKLSETK